MLSALFVNDVVCLVMAPIVLDLARQLRLPPVPYLIALATAANVGSVATLTGNPQNMLVGSFSGISYRAFLLREAPVAVIGLALVFVVIWLVYRRQLPDALPAADLEDRFAVHYPLMIKTIAAVAVMLVAFLAGVPIARGGHRRRRLHAAHAAGEPGEGLPRDRLGAARAVHRALRGHRRGGGDGPGRRGARLGLRGRACTGRSCSRWSPRCSRTWSPTCPAVLLFKSVIPTFGEPVRAWLLLAMASTLAGNLTILGSVANLIVVEQARGAGIPVGFLEYSKVGVPITVLTLLVGWLLLVLLPA